MSGGYLGGQSPQLIDGHTTLTGRLRCGHCGETETYVAQITGRWEQEPDAVWDEYIKRVIGLTPDALGRTPVVFLTAAAPDGEVVQLRVSYYTAPGPDGRLTPGRGPGRPPRSPWILCGNSWSSSARSGWSARRSWRWLPN